MGAIYAELHVGSHVFPVLKCTYGVHQATDRRGRVIEKVRFEGAKLLLDVPRTDFLGVWAADAHKRLPADVLFRDAAGGAAVETLSFQGAYCVHHREVFTAGDAHGGSYVLYLDLSDPDGFTMHAGGPAADFVVPAARDHGVPPVAALLGAAAGGGASLVPNTPAHKAARWAEYQQVKAGDPKAWPYARWEKQYHTNMRNADHGLRREREYCAAMGAVSKTFKTAHTHRQIDMYVEDNFYCGQLKTGKLSLGKQEKIDLQKDEWLVQHAYAVEYTLEKGASKPLLTALDAIGATYKIGPQIP